MQQMTDAQKIDMEAQYQFEYSVPKENYKMILENAETVKEVYPELKNFLERHIDDSGRGCKGCKLNSLMMRMFNALRFIGGSDRDIELLRPLFGNDFIERLKKKEKHPTFDISIILDKPDEYILTKGVRESCPLCTKKHICTARSYYQEMLLGYPDNSYDVIGELVLASHESMDLGNGISEAVRMEMKKFLEFKIKPNFIRLLKMVDKLI